MALINARNLAHDFGVKHACVSYISCISGEDFDKYMRY